MTTPRMNRRQMLARSGLGFGQLALTGLLADAADRLPVAPAPRAAGPRPHFEPKAKRVIFLFMHGGPSQVDTFDPKPLLTRDDGKPLPFKRPRVVFKPTNNLLRSPWKFAKHGGSGIEVSELFPHTAKCVDDLCLIHSMHGSNPEHGAAVLKLHTGSDTFIRPSVGAWVTYGLGRASENLPAFLTVCPPLSHGGPLNWGSAFLPAECQGTPLGDATVKPKDARVSHLRPRVAGDRQRVQLDFLQDLNRDHLARSDADNDLEGRIASYELAFRMQAAVPELQDLSGETAETKRLYGLDDPATADFAHQCLMARRFVERGVRFVQCNHCLPSGGGFKWDQHGALKKNHERNALEVDKPIAALLTDLKRRGLLKDTLVLWGGEFGRTPTAEGTDGRDHNPEGFTVWMAGGGVRGGFRYGKTDDYGYYAVEDKVHLHDLHATMLHLLGLDHEKLTYRYAGRDFRLTDVEGRVVKELMA